MCILNELLLWAEISSEHPDFIKTVAMLTNKNLAPDVVNSLTEVHEMFKDLHRKTITLKQEMNLNPYYYYMPNLMALVDGFLLHDMHFFEVLPIVKSYGKEDTVWQTLLEHITREQHFMYNLMTDLRNQLA